MLHKPAKSSFVPGPGGRSFTRIKGSLTRLRGDRRAMRRIQFTLLALTLIVGLAALGLWLWDRWTHVYLIDARVAANVITVSSESSGRVIAVPIVAGQKVAKGALLVGIETRQAELMLEETSAQLVQIEAERSRQRAQQELIREQLTSRLQSGRAQIAAARAEKEARAAELQAAQSDFDRVRSLYDRNTLSAQRFEQARARFLTAQQQERRSAADIEVAEANVTVTEADRVQIEVIERQLKVLDAQRAALVAQRERQSVDLSKRQIRADFDGVIDATFIDAGEYVSPGTRLLMYHDPRSIWIDANVKETEFGHVKIGAPATIVVDAYSNRTFKGTVEQLGQAATSQFALLPSPNPSGNFTKVTQRLPLRIAIEQDRELLRPGMMVQVSIDVVD